MTLHQRRVMGAVAAFVIMLGLIAIVVLLAAQPEANDSKAQTPKPASVFASQPEPAQAPTPPDSDEALMETVFFTALDKEGIAYAEPSMLLLVERVCRQLNRGGSLIEAARVPFAAGYSSYDSGFIVGAASQSICKETR